MGAHAQLLPRALHALSSSGCRPDFGALAKRFPSSTTCTAPARPTSTCSAGWEDGTITVDALALSPLGAGELAACKDEAEVDVVEALKDVKAHLPGRREPSVHVG
jgi:hypothetical protein